MMKKVLIFALVMFLASCAEALKKPELIDAKAFQTTVDGKQVDLYTLRSESGMTIQVTNLGGRVVALWVEDRDGNFEDVVLGYQSIDRYLNNTGERFLGPVVGRYANRIAKGEFSIDGELYTLPTNNNGQTLHGGLKGLDMVVWNVEAVDDKAIVMTYVSPDGEEGFPGNLTITMAYSITDDNGFKIKYKATTDKTTVVNLSHHTLFNLKGEGRGTIVDNILMIDAGNTTPVDSVLIPTGEIAAVDGGPFDFRTPTAIGERIEQENEQLKNGAGYDHNWVVDGYSEGVVKMVASIYDPASGRAMEVWSDQPGIQFYSGNFFDGKTAGKYGRAQNYREAFALETQKFPDSPNHPNFPSTRLEPGEVYVQECVYKFAVK